MKRLASAGATLALVLAMACGGGGDDGDEATVVPTTGVLAVAESVSEPTTTPTADLPSPTPDAASITAETGAPTPPEPTSTTAAVPTSVPTSAPAAPTAMPGGAPAPAPSATAVPPTATTLPTTATAVPPTATAVPPIPVATPSSESLVRAKAIVLAAEEFGVPVSGVEVDSSEPTTWADEALGCVVPGQLYSSGAVEGWLITVSAGSASQEFHSDGTGDRVITCAEADRVSSLPWINVVNAASLTGVTSVVISTAEGDTEVVRVDDADRIDLVLTALSEPTHLDEVSSCDPLFKVEFVTALGSTSFEYTCSGKILRGTQSFWNGADGISPAGFQLIINAALAARDFPGFPPTP